MLIEMNLQVYPLSFVESFAFGSLISAVDPVATLAIFQALDVEPVLNMLVRNYLKLKLGFTKVEKLIAEIYQGWNSSHLNPGWS